MFEECRDKLKKTTHRAHKPVYEAKLRALTACQDVLKNPSDLEQLEALKAAYVEAKKGDSGANGKLTFFEQVRFKDSDVVDLMMTVISVIRGRNENTLAIVPPTVNAPF
jgi:hypothetical protein